EFVAFVSLEAVRQGKASAEQKQRVEGWLKAAASKNPRSTVLSLFLAESRDLAGAHDEAMILYRRTLEQDPANVMVLNNLALLLAWKEGNHDEALKMINAALDQAGPHPEVLDSRAIIYLLAGNADLATKGRH